MRETRARAEKRRPKAEHRRRLGRGEACLGGTQGAADPANPGDVRTPASRVFVSIANEGQRVAARTAKRAGTSRQTESEDRNEPREPSQRGLATHISRSRLVFSIEQLFLRPRKKLVCHLSHSTANSSKMVRFLRTRFLTRSQVVLARAERTVLAPPSFSRCGRVWHSRVGVCYSTHPVVAHPPAARAPNNKPPHAPEAAIEPLPRSWSALPV